MTSEGGGKLKQKRAHTSKPYDRPKSIFSRVTDAVRGILNPSWVTGLITSQPAVNDTASICNNNSSDHSNATLRRNSLNSLPGPSGVTFPSVAANAGDKRQSVKPRIPLDNEHEPFWNPAAVSRGRSTPTFADHPDSHTLLLTPSSSFVSGYLAEGAAGPSTSTPFDGAKEFAPRRNGEQERVNPGSSSSAPLTPASRQLYAKLSNVGKLNQYSSIAPRKDELESGTNLVVGDSQSECSEESISTSGCSSMVPHPDKREYQRDVLQLSKPALETLSENLQTSISSQNKNRSGWDQTITCSENGQASGNKSSFLFSESNVNVSRSARPQPIAMGSKPQFKPYLLGSPTWMDKSVLQTKPANISFNGKATYGFGSARKVRLNSTAPYSTAPPTSRRHVQVKPVGNADLDVMSNTTKRILETLEKMSTPLMDAKKIPTNKTDSILETPLTFTSTYRRWPSLANKSTSQVSKVEMASAASVSRGPPISRLLTPGSISVTKMFPKPNTPTSVQVSPAMDTSKKSKENSQTTSIFPQGNDVRSATGKMKSSRQREHYSRNAGEGSDEPQEIPALPAFALPLKTLPVFDFFPQVHGNQLPNKEPAKFASPAASIQKPAAAPSTSFVSNNAVSTALSSAAPSTPPTVKTTTTPAVNCTVSRQDSAAISFLFSTPAQVKEAADDCLDSAKSTPTEADVQFEFRPPDSVENKQDSLPKDASNAAPASSNFVFKSPATPVVSSKQKTEYFLEKPIKHDDVPAASELRSGSVLDLLAKFAETNQKNANDGKASSTKAGVLTERIEKSPAVVEVEPKTTSSTPSIGFGNSFKPAAGNWECPACMVSNKVDVTKCVACETAKPMVKIVSAANSASADILPPTTPFSGFGDRFNAASDTWECPSCMLRVKQELTKCAACETPKPGSKPSAPVSIFGNTTPFFSATKNASSTAQSGLKDVVGADPGMWECDTCLVKNQPSTLKCIACESSKPGAASLPAAASGFKFGFTASSTTASPQVFGSQLASGAVAFAANSGSSTTSTSTSLFKFGIPAASQSSTATGDSNVSAGFSFASKNTDKDAAVAPPAAFKFGLPAAVAKDTSKPATTATTGFKFPGAQPVAEIQLQKEQTTAVESEPEVQLDNSIPKDVPCSVAASAPPPAYGLSSSAVQKPAEKIENPLLFKTVVPAMPTLPVVPTISNKPFMFSSMKPAQESTFTFTPATTSLPTLPSVPSAAAPSSGFNFKFGGDTSSPAMTAAAQPATFSFADTKPITKETSTAPATGGFPFTFSAGGKRSADSLDDSSTTKKTSMGSGLPAFGSFSSAGNTAAKAAPTSGFAFGAAPTPSRTPVFGALSSGGDKPAASNTFTFGASTASPNPSPAPAFSAQPMFGSKQPTPFQPATQPTLNFGAPNPLTTSAPAFGTQTNTSTFSFTGQNTAGGNAGSSIPAFGNQMVPSAALPAFGSAPSNPAFGTSPAPSFGVFGAPQAPIVNPTPAPVAPSSRFNFGSSTNFQFGGQPQANTGVFQFSGNQSTEPQTANQGFAFSQLAPTNQQQQPTQQSGFLGQSGFPPPLMSFPAMPPLSSNNPFDIQNKAGGRTIKKAKRRTHQK